MSVFCLIVAPSGNAVAREEIDPLLDPVDYLAPFGREIWTRDNLGVGLLHCTRRSPGGQSDPRLGLDGRLVLAADARLDARADLLAALSIAPAERDRLDDEDLLLAAYLRWGEGCASRLLGDFAFVVFDRRTQQIYGCTDAMGARRLFFARLRSGALAIASEEACLVALPGVAERWCELAVGFWMMAAPHRQLSLFEGIGVAACGQELRGSGAAGLAVRQWWPAKPLADIRYRSLDQYAEHYRHLLGSVVADCLGTGPGSILCELSGGLDSSSVTACAVEAATARGSQVAALSRLYPGLPGCDEREPIAAIRAWLGLSDWHGFDATPTPTQPWHSVAPRAESPSILVASYQERTVDYAAQRGYRTILTGFGGDEYTNGAVSFWAVERLARGDLSFARELREMAQRCGTPVAEVVRERLLKAVLRQFLPQPLVRGLQCRRLVAQNAPPWLARDRRLTRRLAERCREEARCDGATPYLRSLLGKRRRSMSLMGMDAYRYSARARGIDARAPLFDLRIASFALAVPPDLWFRDGYTKFLVRKAFSGRLPQSVLWTREKALFNEAARRHWQTERDSLLDEIALARRGTARRSGLAELMPDADDDLESVNRFQVLYTACLARWSNFDSNGNRGKRR